MRCKIAPGRQTPEPDPQTQAKNQADQKGEPQDLICSLRNRFRLIPSLSQDRLGNSHFAQVYWFLRRRVLRALEPLVKRRRPVLRLAALQQSRARPYLQQLQVEAHVIPPQVVLQSFER